MKTVTQEQFAISGTTGAGIDGCRLHVNRVHHTMDESLARRHLYLTKTRTGGYRFMVRVVTRLFPSKEEAWAWALERGYLREYFTAPELRARRVARAHNPRAER